MLLLIHYVNYSCIFYLPAKPGNGPLNRSPPYTVVLL